MKRVLGITFLFLLWAFPAAAQEKPVTPSSVMPVMPKPLAAPAAPAFPELPPSRICKKQDMVGLWKLQNVFEEPQGTEAAAFSASPVQYVYFKADNTYGRYNSGTDDLPPPTVASQIEQHGGGLLQYLPQDTGFVYFYQNGTANDTQACFIVANAKPPFAAGQLLLMPPQGQIKGRLVKLYAKVWTVPAAAPPTRVQPQAPVMAQPRPGLQQQRPGMQQPLMRPMPGYGTQPMLPMPNYRRMPQPPGFNPASKPGAIQPSTNP